MVFEQRVTRIAMLANVVEQEAKVRACARRDRRSTCRVQKCAHYWPDPGDPALRIPLGTHTVLHVAPGDTVAHADGLVVRTFALRAHEGTALVAHWTVRQCHVTVWADFQVVAVDVLTHAIDALRAPDDTPAGPMVVHCR